MPKEKESTTRLKVDVTDFKKGMSDAQRAIRLANSEFKAATSNMDDWGKSTDGQQAKIKQLNAVMEAEKKKLSLLEDHYKKVVAAQGENSAEAENLKIKMNNQQAAVGKAEKELKNYNEKLKDADKQTQNLTDSEQKADKQTQQLGEQFTASKVALGGLIKDGLEAAGSKLLEMASAAKEAYKELDEGADNVIMKTGATGEAAAKLNSTYEDVARSVKGEFSDLGNIVGEVNTRFGFTDEKLKNASVTFQKFSQITGVDGVAAVQLVSRAMEKAGIEGDKYEEVLDKLAYAGQQTGVDVASLAKSLTDNGSAFKELGFDTDAQISLLATFEKKGVNVSSTLTGMKKAVGNWAKEGKNANTEFGKTIKMIQQAPSDTEAARIAVEAFGSKSGVELAEAMRTGKFSYEDFAQSLKKSSKTVENTYEGTQDGLDKISLAMQGVKVDAAKAFGEFLDENKENIDTAIDYLKTSIIPKAKNILGWTIDNLDTITDIAKGVATTMATIWVLKKTASFAQGIQNGIQMLSGLGTAATSATTAQEGLNAAQSASPIGLLVKGAGLFIGALKAIIDISADNIEVIEKESDKYKELYDDIDRTKGAWDELSKARDDSVDKTSKEFDYYKQLKDELDQIVDKNGRVKTGYEERAKFITGKLSEVTGIEIDNNGKVIKSYDKISAAIDKVIEKKRAQAILNANDSLYNEAVQNKDQYYDNFIKALETWNKEDANVSKYERERDRLETMIKESYRLGDYKAEGDYRKAYEENERLLKEANNNKSRAWTEYLKAKTVHEQASATLKNYEDLSAALNSGDEKKISDALLNMQNKFKTAETTTVQSLKNQRDSFEEHYNLLKSQLEKNTPGITQAMVDQAKTMVDKATEELKKGEKQCSEAGALNAGAYAGSFGSDESKEKAKAAALQIDSSIQSQLSTDLPQFMGGGESVTKMFGKGISDGKSKHVSPAMKGVSNELDAALKAEANKATSYGNQWAANLANSLKKFKMPASITSQFEEVGKKLYGSLYQPQKSSVLPDSLIKQLLAAGNKSQTTTNVFTQINNSPKALTPYETGKNAEKLFGIYGGT